MKCFLCKKKSHILFSCKCNKKFCIKHRYLDEHNCSYNKKKEELDKLKKDNPKIISKKINII